MIWLFEWLLRFFRKSSEIATYNPYDIVWLHGMKWVVESATTYPEINYQELNLRRHVTSGFSGLVICVDSKEVKPVVRCKGENK